MREVQRAMADALDVRRTCSRVEASSSCVSWPEEKGPGRESVTDAAGEPPHWRSVKARSRFPQQRGAASRSAVMRLTAVSPPSNWRSVNEQFALCQQSGVEPPSASEAT